MESDETSDTERYQTLERYGVKAQMKWRCKKRERGTKRKKQVLEAKMKRK